jgi:hypothetical protein
MEPEGLLPRKQEVSTGDYKPSSFENRCLEIQSHNKREIFSKMALTISIKFYKLMETIVCIALVESSRK